MSNEMNYDPICRISSISSSSSKGSSGGASLVAVVDLNQGCFLVFYRMEGPVGFEDRMGLCN